jgi:hypothetical protein
MELTEGLTSIISDLRALDIFESRISYLSQSLAETFVQPLLKGDHSVSSNDALLIKKDHTSHPPDIVFRYLTMLVTHLSAAFPQTVLDNLIPSLLPVLLSNILANFLPAHIPTSITDLPMFDVLLDTVTHFDTVLVNSGWASETPLSTWVSNASKIWFANRHAAVLLETRVLVIRECANQKNVAISSGIDILSDPQIVNSGAVKEENLKEAYSGSTIERPDDDEDEETDGWGFDAADDEAENTTDLHGDTEMGDTEPDSWNWDDENDDLKPLTKDSNSSFPYSLSPIPQGLMEIVERLLDEGLQLQSPRWPSLHSVSLVVILAMRL